MVDMLLFGMHTHNVLHTRQHFPPQAIKSKKKSGATMGTAFASLTKHVKLHLRVVRRGFTYRALNHKSRNFDTLGGASEDLSLESNMLKLFNP